MAGKDAEGAGREIENDALSFSREFAIINQRDDMKIEELPGRIFLDTCTVNFVLDYGENIFDGTLPDESLPKRIKSDIEALYNIMLVGKRAMWQLAISPLTYEEIINTNNDYRKFHIEAWFKEIWGYWLRILQDDSDKYPLDKSEQIRINILSSGILDIIPERNDKSLILDSIIYQCDFFCTRDWKTMLKYRNLLAELPIKIITPSEWWEIIRPYSGLWA